ncbi:MAG: hypothetical protein WD492_08220 [Alkalispirochaeta sp.]
MLNVVLLIFFALWVRRLILRRLEPERVLSDLSDEIGELIAELNQTGDHNVSVLEDRIMQLRDLVADADRQIEELSALVEQTQAQQSPDDPVYTVSFSGSGSDDAFERGPVDTEDDSRSLWKAPRTETPTEPVDPAQRAQPPQPTHASEPVEPRREVLSPREKVRELHEQGLSSEIIAGKTGMAIGEVELIISLGSGRGGR